MQNSWEGDQTSIISYHFMKAKQLYVLKKIFNNKCLKVYFDIFVLRTFRNWNKGYDILK